MGLFGVLVVLLGGVLLGDKHSPERLISPWERDAKVCGRDMFFMHCFWTSHLFCQGCWVVPFWADFFLDGGSF